MKRIICLSITALLALAFAGCMTAGKQRAGLYIAPRNAAVAESAAHAPKFDGTLVINRIGCVNLLNTRRIRVIDENTGVASAFADADFAEPPALTLTDAARRRLDASGLFSDVIDSSVRAPGDIRFNGWLDEAFVVKSTNDTLAVRLKLTARFDTKTPRLAPLDGARFDYAETVPLADTKNESLAAAFSAAISNTLHRLEADLRKL